jgi:hypothetical protein
MLLKRNTIGEFISVIDFIGSIFIEPKEYKQRAGQSVWYDIHDRRFDEARGKILLKYVIIPKEQSEEPLYGDLVIKSIEAKDLVNMESNPKSRFGS